MPTFLSMVLPLEGAKSIQGASVSVRQLLTLPLDAVARVREYILSTPDIYNDTSKVITGGGWDHTI